MLYTTLPDLQASALDAYIKRGLYKVRPLMVPLIVPLLAGNMSQKFGPATKLILYSGKNWFP